MLGNVRRHEKEKEVTISFKWKRPRFHVGCRTKEQKKLVNFAFQITSSNQELSNQYPGGLPVYRTPDIEMGRTCGNLNVYIITNYYWMEKPGLNKPQQRLVCKTFRTKDTVKQC